MIDDRLDDYQTACDRLSKLEPPSYEIRYVCELIGGAFLLGIVLGIIFITLAVFGYGPS